MDIDWEAFGQQFASFSATDDASSLTDQIRATQERADKLKASLYEQGDMDRWSRMSAIADLLEEAATRADALFKL